MRVQLNGSIIGDEDQWLFDFFEVPAFSPGVVRNAIAANPDGEDLVLEINSGGGSVFAGFEMYSALRNASCHTVAEVQSLAASAASILMLGADEVQASPVAQVMIHLPAVRTDGDRYAHQYSIDVLDSITESLLNAYTIKAGGKTSRDELKRQMKAETWMTAPEAKAMGLVDRITGEEEIDPAAILNCAGSGGLRALAASAAVPAPGELRARYEKLVEAGKAPARNGGKADPEPAPTADNEELLAAHARLELEKARFGGFAL